MADNEVVTTTLTPYEEWAALPETPEAEAKPIAAAEEVKPEPASEPEEEQDPSKAPEDDDLPKGLKKRFKKLTGKIRDLEAQVAAKPAAAAPKEVETAPATPAGKPEAAAYPDYEKYMEALTEWTVDQREAKRTAEENTRKQQESARSFQSKWEKSVEEAKGRHDDWDEVVGGATDVPITPVMKQTIFEMERGPDVVHYLAKNPGDAKRIALLPLLSQARELGKIEDKLAPKDDGEPEPKPAVSAAPKPAKVLAGSTANDASKEPDPKDFTKWSKWKDKQEARASQ